MNTAPCQQYAFRDENRAQKCRWVHFHCFPDVDRPRAHRGVRCSLYWFAMLLVCTFPQGPQATIRGPPSLSLLLRYYLRCRSALPKGQLDIGRGVLGRRIKIVGQRRKYQFSPFQVSGEPRLRAFQAHTPRVHIHLQLCSPPPPPCNGWHGTVSGQNNPPVVPRLTSSKIWWAVSCTPTIRDCGPWETT